MPKFLKTLLIMAFAMAIMSSCEKDLLDVPDVPDSPIERKEPLVMTFHDFIYPDDVMIVSADTTSISVNSTYAEKMGITDFKDRAVTIWRSIGTVPFIRIIKDAKQEDGKIILTTEKGEFCDMFENLDVSLETSLFVNNNYVPKATTRAGSNLQVDDVSGKYIDASGVHHPSVIIFQEDSPAVRGLQTRSGETKNYFTAEELLEDNLSFDIINVHNDFLLDYAYPKTDEDKGVSDSDAKIHIKGKFGVLAKLSAYTDIKISWFKLKKFEAGVKGTTELSAKMNVGVEKGLTYDWEKKLFEIGEVTAVFWIGIIPIPYSIEAAIYQRLEASAKASIALYASAYYKLGFEKGCRYTSDFGWEDLSKDGRSEKGFKIDGVKGSAELEASAATNFEIAVKLGGCAGPTFSLGPKLSAEANATATITDEKFTVDANIGAYIGLAGRLGAKAEILGYTLAKWSTGFDLFKVTLFNGSFSYTYTNDEWNKMETEWTNLVNKNSSEWEWNDNTRSVAVPYRLPDPE